MDNYHEIKNKLKLLLNNNKLNQEYFIDFLYKYSLEQLSYQRIYSNLCKDIYLHLLVNKNNLKFFRKKIIEKCKQNLINKKICEENRTIINNNISLIAELINSKIFPKKVGLKCLKYLISKFEKYSELGKNNIKYMYLECILLLLNIFCGNIYNYQKERTHNEFDEEIKKIIEKLNDITKDEKNKDIPLYTKHLLLQLIEKAEKSWELPSYEKEKYESHFKVFNIDENSNINMVGDNNEENKSFNDSSFIKQDEYDKSFEEEVKKENNNNNIIISDGIEREIDKLANNKYPNKYYNNQNKNDYYKGKYSNTNKNNNNKNWRQEGDKYNNNNNDYKNNKNNYDNNNNYKYNSSNSINSNNNNNYYKYNSSTSNNNNNSSNNNYFHKYNNNNNGGNFKKYYTFNKYNKKNDDNHSSNTSDSFFSSTSLNNAMNNSSNNTYNINNNKKNNYGKIILSNLKQFKRHMDTKNNVNNFKWDDINDLIVNSKIGMNDFIEGLIESCISFTISNSSFYYIDLYINSIFNFYYDYLDENDISDIKDVIVKHLKKLGNNIYYNKNYYLEDIWVIMIYYLINSNILTFSFFNIFNKDYSNIKRDIINVLNKVVDYNKDNKNYFLKELKNSKFYNENKKLFEKF